MNLFYSIVIAFVSLVSGLLLGKYFPSYFTEKGRNRARREDCREIVKIEEGAKVDSIVVADRYKRYEDVRVKAYVDLCESFASLAVAQNFGNKDKEMDATIRLADARGRIAIYGSKEVAIALGEFFKTYGHTCSPEALVCYVDAVRAMRWEVVGDVDLDFHNVISRLYFSQDLPELK